MTEQGTLFGAASHAGPLVVGETVGDHLLRYVPGEDLDDDRWECSLCEESCHHKNGFRSLACR